MEKHCRGVNATDKNFNEGAEDLEKVLAVVVKRRKTIPTKCMELFNQTAALETLRLENARVIIEQAKGRENFKKTVQGLKILKSFQFSLDDLHEAEKNLEKYHNRIKEINSYLEGREKHIK